MNIYEKLLKAREEIKQQELKKSGQNTFAKYTYYELADILPAITKSCDANKILPVVTFTNEIAKLTIYDLESSDTIEFTSPMVESETKGATKIQNLGAVETYQRRYLYMTAFEIVETDTNDRLTQDDSLHNIFVIKNRVEKLITEKIEKGITKEDLLKKLNLNSRQLEMYLGYYESLNKLEQAIKGI